MSKRCIATWLPLLAVVVALTLRLVALERKSLWCDEVETLRIAALETKDILTIRTTQHPPLYFLLISYWTGSGQDEFLLRLPAVFFGAAAIPILYLLIREWDGRWSATASAWLLTVAPLHVWYSQEARMYTLVCMFGLASSLLYTLAIRREKPLVWAAWIVATALGLYTHYSMLLLMLVQIALFGPLWKANGSRRPVLWAALFALLVVSLLFAPQAHMLVVQLMQSGWEGGYYYLSVQSLLSGWGIAISPEQLYAVVILGGVITLGAVILSAQLLLARLRGTHISTGLILATVALYLLILIATAVPRVLGIKRQVLILLPYVLGGAAAIISRHRRRFLVLIGLVLVTLPLTGYVIVGQEQEAWRDVAHSLEQQEESQDVILVNAPYMQQPLDYYYRGEVPRQGIRPGDVPETLLEITGSHERVWLVLSHDTYTDPQGKVQTWLDENCTLLNERVFPGVCVRLYDSEGPPD